MGAMAAARGVMSTVALLWWSDSGFERFFCRVRRRAKKKKKGGVAIGWLPGLFLPILP